jgi:transposase-like protein
MRRSASEKMELIGLVERTDLPVRVTLRQLGIPSSTFYGWYKRYVDGGFDALQDKTPPPRPRWNQVPEKVRAEVIDLALKKTELSARELACHFTDERVGPIQAPDQARERNVADRLTSRKTCKITCGSRA